MRQIALATAWYCIPKGIEFLTSAPSRLESRIDHVRAKFFAYKSRFDYPNEFTKYTFKAALVIVSHMWFAILTTLALEKMTGFNDPSYGFLKIAICYALFSTKASVIKLINSDWGLGFITSEFGLKWVKNPLGSFLINQSLRTSCLTGEQELLDILNRKLQPLATSELLRIPCKPPFIRFSVIEKIKFWKQWEKRAGCPIDLVLPIYPKTIHDTDPILSKIQCPLLGKTPRSLITDPTDKKTIYDTITFKTYLKHADISPITKEKIPTSFHLFMDGGSQYDCIVKYRKACLRSKKLQNAQAFIANLRTVFTEVLTLNNARDVKKASNAVRDFFQEGFFATYDAQYFTVKLHRIEDRFKQGKSFPHALAYIKRGLKLCSYSIHKAQHNIDHHNDSMGKPLASKKGFIAVSIDDFEKYPFIENELNLEIEKIKTTGQSLIQDFL